ncbi:hypothetical protein BGI37_13655 [Snodgrassella alvi]|nr:hypothetical protein BGI37_13655 [Snodgrassella alvi]
MLAQVRQRVTLKGLKNSNELRSALKKALYELLLSLQQPLILLTDKKPFVIKMTGCEWHKQNYQHREKLAKYYQSQGKSVLLAAGYTFRAAEREQL